MTRTEHLLVILMEECNEVAQRASKALRFGLEEVQPGQELTNARRIVDEMNDLHAVYQMITEGRLLFRGDPHEWFDAIDAKKAKVEKFLAYSKECGTLDEDKTP